MNGGLFLVVAKESSGSVQGKPVDGARFHLACSHRGAESYAAEHWGQWWQRFLGSTGPGWTVGCFPVTCRCQELLLPVSVVTAVAAFCYTCLKLQDTDNISSSVQVFGISPGKLPNFRQHSENSESTRVKFDVINILGCIGSTYKGSYILSAPFSPHAH